MFDEYRRALLNHILMTAALIAHTLAIALPASIAAMIGMFVGLVFGSMQDEVNKRFRDDVARILQPTDGLSHMMVGAVVFGVCAAGVMAGIVPAGLAAPAGVMLLLVTVKKIMGG